MNNAFVYVIESPSNRDLLDGRTEGRLLTESLRLAEIPHWYSLASNLLMFRESLGARLEEASKFHNKLPILHLSLHGSPEGVVLTSGESLTWDGLRKELMHLTRAMQGGLLVCMSSCFGSSGCRMAMYEDNEPHFWALVGNTASALWSDAAVAYASFYHLFFKGFDIELCVNSMQVASGDHNFVFYTGAEMKAGWESFIQARRQELEENVETAANEASRKFDKRD